MFLRRVSVSEHSVLINNVSPPRPPASHDLTNVIYRGVAGKEKGGQGRAPSPYQLLLDKLVKSNLSFRLRLGYRCHHYIPHFVVTGGYVMLQCVTSRVSMIPQVRKILLVLHVLIQLGMTCNTKSIFLT